MQPKADSNSQLSRRDPGGGEATSLAPVAEKTPDRRDLRTRGLCFLWCWRSCLCGCLSTETRQLGGTLQMDTANPLILPVSRVEMAHKSWCTGTILIPIPTCVWAPFTPPSNFLQYQLRFLRFNSTLTLSTWQWHQIPQVQGSVPWDCTTHLPPPTSDANRQSRLSPVLLTDLLQVWGSHDPLLRFGWGGGSQNSEKHYAADPWTMQEIGSRIRPRPESEDAQVP